MKKQKVNDFLADIDVDAAVMSTIKADVAQAFLGLKTENRVDEAYVAQQKQYRLTTEFLNEKSKKQHVELYKNYLETLNRVSAEVDASDRSDVNSRHSAYRSNKIDEVRNLNAVWLHELFFANCFAPSSTIYVDSPSYMKLQGAFGDFDTWQRDFLSCALGAGQGWAVCGYNMFLKQYVNTFISDHSDNVMLGLFPLLVVDMHEHAYVNDFEHDKVSYAIAMMREINWDVVDERVNRAEMIAGALK
jgi:Fe-Mn family superoxide dismutase